MDESTLDAPVEFWTDSAPSDQIELLTAGRLDQRISLPEVGGADASPRDTHPATAPVTICHPVFAMGRGGLERQLLQVMDVLPARQFQHVLVIRGHDANASALEDSFGDNVEVIYDPAAGRDWNWWRRLAAIAREHAVDLLHMRGLSMLIDGVRAGRRAAIPTAFSFHGIEHDAPRAGALKRACYRAAIAKCTARWAVSTSAAKAIQEMLDIDGSGFAILPNGVNTERYAPTARKYAIRRRLDLPLDRHIFVNVGNLKPVKGHSLLLDAVAGLRRVRDRFTLVIVGADYMGGVLQARAARELCDLDIRFVGQQSVVLPWLQAADTFVLPSRFEGSSNAMLEAMACGLAVVATDVGGNADSIEHGKTGLLVPPSEPIELASALQFLMKDDVYRGTMGAAARLAVQRSHTVREAARRYGAAYLNLAGRRGLVRFDDEMKGIAAT